jgi:hypothetical protein
VKNLLITQPGKHVRPVGQVKPAGSDVTVKPNVQGKSKATGAIKNPAGGTGKGPNAASVIKNPGTGKTVQLSNDKAPTGSPTGKTTSAKVLFVRTAANLGFPKDALSVSLIAFARYFSISLSSSLIKTLRREILASGKSSTPETPAEKAALEADALSALIANDKGVSLSSEALEHYARFLSFPEENTTWPDEGEDQDREEYPSAEELRILIEEQGQNDDTLSFLNNLPGKNGQRWLVFPFSVKVKGTEFKVFVRLLRKEPVSFEDNEEVIIDISGPKRQWRCFIKKADESFMADIRVYPQQPPGALKLLQKEAKQMLKNAEGLFGVFRGFDEVLVRNGEETPSWVEDLCAESLPSIDEEV